MNPSIFSRTALALGLGLSLIAPLMVHAAPAPELHGYIVGGAALIVGAVVGGQAGTIVMIAGGVLGLVGLWNYLQ